MCVEAGLSGRLTCLALWAFEGSFVGYEGIQGGFEEPWKLGTGSAEESGLLLRHGQGYVGPSRGLEGRSLPLSSPAGVRLAPTSPKLVERQFSEVRVQDRA
jgi:hypothetical protein